jgi:hypothetical protein
MPDDAAVVVDLDDREGLHLDVADNTVGSPYVVFDEGNPMTGSRHEATPPRRAAISNITRMVAMASSPVRCR